MLGEVLEMVYVVGCRSVLIGGVPWQGAIEDR